MEHRLPVTGFVLAGGASRRMGQDKTKLVLNGETMLKRHLHYQPPLDAGGAALSWSKHSRRVDPIGQSPHHSIPPVQPRGKPKSAIVRSTSRFSIC